MKRLDAWTWRYRAHLIVADLIAIAVVLAVMIVH